MSNRETTPRSVPSTESVKASSAPAVDLPDPTGSGDTGGTAAATAPAREGPGLILRIMIWALPLVTAFIASFCIMVLEIVAGRVIARYLGASLYTWTAVIGIVLAGISLGNLLGGRLADWFRPTAVLAVLFLLASGTCVLVPYLNRVASNWDWTAAPADSNPYVRLLFMFSGAEEKLPWSARVFGHVLVVFLLPSTLLGTIGPVVAKMALDQSKRIGRTVGNVYSWGALGSIVGTFLTGYYLISKLGTEAVVFSVGGVLGLMGILFAFSLLWSAAGPREALMAFFGVFWALAAPVVGLYLVLNSWGFFTEQKWRWTWVERDGRHVLREVPEDEEVVYLDESNYSFIKVEATPEKEGEEAKRELVLDHLIHAYFIPGDITNLRYDYEDIYKALTHRFAPSEARSEASRRPAALFIGGGGYVYPRYLRAKWPGCYIEIAEIDPAVTLAVLEEFGLPRDQVQIVERSQDRNRPGNPMWIYHMDARNHVEDLIRRKDSGETVPEFDFVYGDAFNDYAVPFHLTTLEYTQKVKRLLKPETGLYLINIIDIYNPGKFLGAIYNTFVEVFGSGNVWIYCSREDGPSQEDRDTFVVVGAQRPLDLRGLPGDKEPYVFEGSLLTEEHLKKLTSPEQAGSLYLTDDYAPVENLLQNVVNRGRW